MAYKVKPINYEEIYSSIYYKDGLLFWKSNNKIAGTKTKAGYIKLQINKISYSAHRLVWVLFNKDIPLDKQIDHIDRDKSNNKIENLRLVDHVANALNKKCKKSNTGIRGVSKDRNYYKVSFTIKNKSTHVGNFKNFEDAKKVAEEYYQNIIEESFV
tara:strand:+ start:112 stop:582 length:471 start_codon:yes stop_codon:yes gene_type:complete